MTARPLTRPAAERLADRLRPLAQPQRLMILSLLLAGEHTVGEIETRTGIGQPALSQQLAELRRSGLVTTRRAARQVHYRIADTAGLRQTRAILTLFGDDAPQIRAEAPADPVPATPSPATPSRAAPPPDGAARFVHILAPGT
ncbi:transcriptional regulator, ArsR family [Gluconacetobacter diazotrophicus PA1 5]|uniref:Putative transcriptional regulator ArsR n=1 Tax=Gluconacetobacter diazotrophicus (strain ATCC 49037 / DSM 5601 / CCUG 37298 / CIP 103539 / LMG 7603 / PAl5) TaxID=272568 RepID=A9HA00_GLUDA|nr:metalloregulator ArsR/SmtB family transcription factor [Gluconacetobacter diazotrophicus]ACI52437.1 transcriptional regulator, ArsR family [Gluconacetobacter diazotrophicus PA1 5]TWB00672.1 ArsR family transcriptional regulator [Gluconacetobacter diazotrophicus]CAP57774.1 putative transcriptional regulator ArsR [Gluconacetobacter diazotrophicus PA1 5]